MISTIVSSLIIGLIVGAIARFVMPGRDPMGCLATALLGIAGSFVGGVISHLFILPWGGIGWVKPGFFLSVLGAILVLWIWRQIRR